MQSRAHPYGRLAGELGDSPFSAVTYVAETGSTNEDAARLLGDPRHSGLSIVAERQRRGSGRKGRVWIAQPGTSLLVTTILPQPVAASGLWAVPFWTALAVRSALAQHGIATELHWPNDLLVSQNGKVAGILCVSRVIGEIAWVACGVGVNVHRRPGAHAGIDPAPAFCDDVASVDRATLLLAILREYDASLDLLADPPGTAARWEAAAGLPGARYRIVKDGAMGDVEFVALRLSDDGGLVVERDGRTEIVSLADARALR
jgi:BirA family biotin operon repressor/biotin-[acetyl-CoA-carboxylase] ligase